MTDELVRDALRELANEQRRLWLAAGGPEVSSFAECVSRLLDDSGLTVALEAPAPVYGPETDREPRRLARLVDGIDGTRAPEAILADPRIGEARKVATEVLERLEGGDRHRRRAAGPRR